MILNTVIVSLTGLIAVLATWTAIGLLRKEAPRVDNLARIGLRSPVWPIATGLGLLAAVAALIVGWWITAIGIAAIVAIKLAYFAMLTGYHRADQSRDRDIVNIAMTAHSVAAIALIVAW